MQVMGEYVTKLLFFPINGPSIMWWLAGFQRMLEIERWEKVPTPTKQLPTQSKQLPILMKHVPTHSQTKQQVLYSTITSFSRRGDNHSQFLHSTIAPSDCQWPKKCEGRKWMMIAAFPRGEMPRQSKNPRILCVKNRTPCAQIFIDHPSRCLRLGHVAIRNCQNTQWKIYWNSE